LPLVTPFGRKRRLYADLFGDDPTKLSRALRQRVNAPIQGTASDITVRSLIRLYYAFKKENVDARIVLTVHDSILIEMHDDVETIAYVNKLIDDIMIFRFPNSDIPFLVDKKEMTMWEK
jgi:DNA polymerase-1